MSELVSSAQLAEMALPILPKSKQGIEHVAKRDGWPFEYIKGQGRGGRLKKFVLSGLPASAAISGFAPSGAPPHWGCPTAGVGRPTTSPPSCPL